MKTRTCIAITLAVALGACGKSGQQAGGNGSASGTAGSAPSAGTAPSIAASGASQLQPGLWEMTYETTNVTGAGLPPGYVAAMKGHKVTRRDCITPEQAANPMGKMMQAQEKGECDFKGFSIAGGRIQGTITCGGGAGKSAHKTTIAMNGQFDGQNYAYTSRMSSEGQGMNMTIESQSAAHRVGDCPAGGVPDDAK
jgi:hypothetical protein